MFYLSGIKSGLPTPGHLVNPEAEISNFARLIYQYWRLLHITKYLISIKTMATETC